MQGEVQVREKERKGEREKGRNTWLATGKEKTLVNRFWGEEELTH